MIDGFLSRQDFIQVIERAPLISIDLIIKNKNGDILLGRRTNRPAKGYWFVPGGRIFKNELLADAFLRLTQTELGEAIPLAQAKYLGIYEHLYKDCVFDERISTHYVVLAYELELSKTAHCKTAQHDLSRWFNIAELNSSESVHQNTKNYFIPKFFSE